MPALLTALVLKCVYLFRQNQ